MNEKVDISSVIPSEPASTDPEYLAWYDAKVRDALKAKSEGRASYKSIDEIAIKFGLDAR